ncbi:hypothetical protein NBRC3280_0713 [Acetobacter pasteurianus NBRC 3280]|uniref:Uncharacterized protein n=1 Tax=Acetobacter pasteurianus NBRC 3278 TaxID=1226660 RepID=A0A401X1N5_ACEPA|nr:hypothetical protein [Acetobacter pasteurianus]GCD61702.1 hypothetical protein NBRC3278_0795 [Acetobacter pasteurianus NBRC 3278]GCD68078.1 hypothetical protein NBRC3280_0713 [Acetobacter pasteurianus NBRC 3280]
MSKIPTDIILTDQAASLEEIQNAMLMMMRELYERMDEQSDPAPTHANAAAWGDGLSWLARSVGNVRDNLKQVAASETKGSIR